VQAMEALNVNLAKDFGILEPFEDPKKGWQFF
jgi:hypothetical protein